MIKIRGLNYIYPDVYPDGTRALHDINLAVSEGECMGIVGANGAGKSTFLLQLNGILRGTGEITVAGLKLTDQNISRIRSIVGLVFQDPDDQLFMPTVRDDVGFGPTNMGMSCSEVENAIERALGKVDMHAFISRSSHHLSLGEKKESRSPPFLR